MTFGSGIVQPRFESVYFSFMRIKANQAAHGVARATAMKNYLERDKLPPGSLSSSLHFDSSSGEACSAFCFCAALQHFVLYIHKHKQISTASRPNSRQKKDNKYLKHLIYRKLLLRVWIRTDQQQNITSRLTHCLSFICSNGHV